MRKFLLALPIAAMAAGCHPEPAQTTGADSSDSVRNIILDMDLGSSTDDIICMDLLFGYQADGRARILGLICDRMGNQNAAVADIYRTYYGCPNLPIGLERNGVQNPKVFNDYAPLLDTSKSADGRPLFPRQLTDYAAIPDACQLYRQLLAQAEDRSVDIVSCGFVTSLANLLESQGDDISPLSGIELVRQKVARLYIMCGVFSAADEPDFNLSQAPAWAESFFARWPKETPIEFNPMEVGQDLDYRPEWVTADLKHAPSHPTRHIYLHPGDDTGQRMWDVVSLLYLMEDPSLFEVSEPGWAAPRPDWSMAFSPDSAGRHRYLKPLKPENADKLMNLIRTRMQQH